METSHTRSVPLVYSGMLSPFIAKFELRGGDLDMLLSASGSSRELIAQETVAAQLAYDLINKMAAVLDDPTFGYSVGVETPFPQLPNLAILQNDRAALGELLTALVVDSKNLTSLAKYSLSTDQDQAVLAQHRNFRPARAPAQPDGFFTGFILRLIRETIGANWNPAKLEVRVSNAKAIPHLSLPTKSVLSRPRADVRIRFPSNWLLVRQGGKFVQGTTSQSIHIPNLVDGVRELLALRMSETNVRTEEIANSLMISKRVLQLELAKAGTSVRREMARIRKARACQLLTGSALSIAEVGVPVGYPDPAGFSRAFRGWVGVSPIKYRSGSESQSV